MLSNKLSEQNLRKIGQYLASQETYMLPELDEQGNVIGFFDPRVSEPEGQPKRERLREHLNWLQMRHPKMELGVGQPIPGFDINEPFKSEGLTSSLANMFKASYEGSLTGSIEKALGKIGIGDEKADMFGLIDTEKMKYWEPSDIEKIGTEIFSFLQPLDLATFFVGGGAGGVIGKAAAQGAAKMALKKAVPKMIERGIQSSVMLGTYEGTRGFFEGFNAEERNLFQKTIKDATKGAVMGAAFGVGGAAVPATIAGSRIIGAGAKFGTEIMTLGTVAPFIDGRMPTFEDIKHAAGFLVGMKTAGGILRLGPLPFQRRQAKKTREIQERIEAGEDPNEVFFNETEKIIRTNPDKYNQDIFNRIVRAESGRQIGTIEDFVKDPDWLKFFGKYKKTPMFVSRETPKAEGQYTAGWVEWTDAGDAKIWLNPERPEVLGTTIMHELGHVMYGKSEMRAETFERAFGQYMERRTMAAKGWTPDTILGTNRKYARIEKRTIKNKEVWRVKRLAGKTAEDKLKMLEELEAKAKAQNISLSLDKSTKTRNWYAMAKDRGYLKQRGKYEYVVIPEKGKELPKLGKRPQFTAQEFYEKRVRVKPKLYRPLKQEPWASLQYEFKPENIVDRKFDRKRDIAFKTIPMDDSFVGKVKAKTRKLNLVPPFLRQLKNRFKEIEGKAITTMITEADNIKAYWKGHYFERLIKLGLDRLSADEAVALGKRIMAGKSPEYKLLFDNMWERIVKAEPELKGKGIDHYLPRKIQREVLEKLMDDIRAIEKELSGVQEISDKAVLNMLKKRSESTLKLYEMNKEGRSARAALDFLKKNASADYINEPGFLRKRKLDIPSEYMEKNPQILMPQYIKGVSQWLAEREIFGKDYNKANKLLKTLREKNFQEADLATKAIQLWNGKYEIDNRLPGSIRKVVDAYVGFQVGAKIGMGQATILNLGQFLISMVPDIGLWNTIRGATSILDPKIRGQIRLTGAVSRYIEQAMTMVAGHRPSGPMGWFADKMTKYSGFQGINRGLQYLAAATAREGIKSWVKQARGKGFKAEWARKRLADFKIDYKQPITKEKMFKAMYRFAIDSQLQRNILNEPLFFNNPITRPFVLFKRFGYRQAAYMKDMMKREVGRGNLMPILRLAVGGWFGGTGIVWGINQVKTIISGEPHFRKDDTFLDQIITDLGYIGAFGMLSDVMEIDNMARFPSKLKFVVAPVIYSDIEKVYGALTKITEDWQRYGDGWLATRRHLGELAGPLGTFPRKFIERSKTEAQKANKVKYLKSNEKEELFKLLLEGDGQTVSDRIARWNKNYPDNPFGMHEINSGTLRQWMRRKAQTYAAAKSKDKSPEYRRIFREKLAKLKEKYEKMR